LNWMGLPTPSEVRDPTLFVAEMLEARGEREQRQLDVAALIDSRGVGKAAFDAAGGWAERANNQPGGEALRNACAEWADSEMVSAHIAYQNDLLCTDDFARAAGRSVFDMTNRAWLVAEFGVAFRTLGELVADLAVDRKRCARVHR
jgi:hypothetical protein